MPRVVSVWLPRFATDRLRRIAARQKKHQANSASPSRRKTGPAPLVTSVSIQGGMRVAAVNAAAETAGIIPGITLADARALVPALAVEPCDAVADARELAALADWCGRYSPWTAGDGSAGEGGSGLWIDITGCAHLFGGEDALLADLVGRLKRIGYTARAALADSPGAAWAVARFAPPSGRKSWHIVAPGQAQAVLADFPIAGLRLAGDMPTTLERLGLKTIGDLEAAPRATLAARFGKELVTRLDQAMGRCREAISPRQPLASVQARVVFAEPIGHLDDVERATHQLVEKACADLGRLQHGARKLVLTVYRVDGKVVTVGVGTSRPVRDPRHLERLFGEHLDKLDLGFGADVMALFVTESNPLIADQLKLRNRGSKARFHKSLSPPKPPSFLPKGLTGPNPNGRWPRPLAEGAETDDYTNPVLSEAEVESAMAELAEPLNSWEGAPQDQGNETDLPTTLSEDEVEAAIDRLTDRIGNRLGADNVVRFSPRGSYLPERAVQSFSPLAIHADSTGSPLAETVDIEIPWLRGLPRPLCLFLRPEPIEAVAPVPDDPPVLFRWRKQLHRIAWAEGPERLGTEWWREAGLSSMPESLRTRDYFRVEDTAGQRFWLYRNGLYRQSATAPVLVVRDRDTEPEKPHSYERKKLTAIPKFESPGKSPKPATVLPAVPAEGTPLWFVHGLFA